MAGTGPGDLFAFADELLSFAAEALDTIPILEPGLDGAQDRQVVTQGLPVDDCDQLSVYVPQLAEAGTTPGGLGAAVRPRVGRVDHTSFNIRSIRCCVPIGRIGSGGDFTPPSVPELTASGQQLYADGWALWHHLHNLKASEVLTSLCQQMFFDGMLAVTPSGGCAGWVAFIRAELDGYVEALGS